MCKAKGCRRKSLVKKHQLCAMHYQRFRRTGKTERSKTKKWKHVILGIDKRKMTGECLHCGDVRLTKRIRKSGLVVYICKVAIYKWQKENNYGFVNPKYKKHKKVKCARCGFVAENSCQLDVHHLNGNHKNNTKRNLQTLCSNCHRLVEFNIRQKRTQARLRP